MGTSFIFCLSYDMYRAYKPTKKDRTENKTSILKCVGRKLARKRSRLLTAYLNYVEVLIMLSSEKN